jgi:hypothetical protein
LAIPAKLLDNILYITVHYDALNDKLEHIIKAAGERRMHRIEALDAIESLNCFLLDVVRAVAAGYIVGCA